MDQELISIIVACYNVEKYLDRCIGSIVQQNYTNLEIILVDDGSTDTTPSICDKWAEADNRIKVIHKKNGGLSDARNTGIKLSHGMWIGFVDGDDYIRSTMYENLYNNRTKDGITVCGYDRKIGNTEISCEGFSGVMTPIEAVYFYLNNEIRCHYYEEVTFFGSYAWNKLYDRNLFNDVRYPTGKKYEDIFVIFDLLHIAKKICFIPSCEYVYVQNPNSITQEQCLMHESLNARMKQKKQLHSYWKMDTPLIDELIACEYFLILSRYTSLSLDAQKQEKGKAIWAWKNLCKLGYKSFPIKKKAKLFLFVHFPKFISGLRKIKKDNR